MTPKQVTLVSALSSFDSASPGAIGLSAPPLGVLTLAAVLRPEFTVQVIDLDEICRQHGGRTAAFRAAVIESIVATNPDLIGFSSVSGSFPTTIGLARLASERLPGLPIVLGGPQASVVDIAVLKAFPFISQVVRGEADETFSVLLRAVFENGQINSLPGVTFRANGRIVRNPNGAVLLDMDRMPEPAFDLHPRIARLTSLPIEAGRGCPFSCTFCSTNDFFRRRFRLKSARRLLDEMRHLDETYGVRQFDLVHDMFTVDRKKVVELCDVLIEAGTPYRWSCSARTDCVDAELLGLMKESGCVDVFFGIETGSQRMQTVIDKMLDLEQSRAVFRHADSIGLLATCSLIAGYPGETMEDFRQTVGFFSDMMQYSRVSRKIYLLSPLAQTPITTRNWSSIYLHPDWPEISENGLGQTTDDQALIVAHQDVFPNFYTFATELDPVYLRRVRDFLFYGAIRCEGLLRALYRNTGDLLRVFDAFDQLHGPHSADWFNQTEFPRLLVDFAEEFYGEDVAIALMARFYRAALTIPDRQPGVAALRPEAIQLRRGVQIVTCDCDVVATFKALNEGVPANPAWLDRTVTVVARTFWPNRVEISEFPPVSLAILRHAERGATAEEIVSSLNALNIRIGDYGPSEIVPAALELLERRELIRRPVESEAEPEAALVLQASG